MEFYILIAIVLAFGIYAAMIYNKLVRLKNQGENAFAQIDVQLKRRYDLIPNLVNTAKGYMAHERETLEAVIAARNKAAELLDRFSSNLGDAQTATSLGRAESGLGASLGQFQIAVEAYPDLKASANMMQLSEELTSTENKVSFSRQAYNDAVTAYNTYRQSFPPVMLAGLFRHGEDLALLDFDDREKLQAAPQVSF